MDKPFPAYRGELPYLFVSYAHEDAEQVFPELAWLHAQGFRIWYDAGIKPGHAWRAELSESIRGSSLFIYFVTPRSVRSEHCGRELELAVDLKIPIIAVHLQRTELPSGIDIALARLQAILRYELSEHSYRQALLGSVSDHLERGVAQVDYRPPASRRRGWPAAALAAIAVAVLVGLTYSAGWPGSRSAPNPTLQVTKFLVPVSNGYLPPFGQPDIALSPDGNLLAFANGEELWIRRMDEFESQPVPGSRDAHGPFFSPDSKYLAFTQSETMRRFSIDTGATTNVATGIGPNFSGHWGPDDSIVFSPIGNLGISRVAAGGGAVEQITKVDSDSGETSHLWPQLLQEGRLLLYTAIGPSGKWVDAKIVLQDLDTGTRTVLVEEGSCATYVDSGYLVYSTADGTIMVAAFDPNHAALASTPMPAQTGVLRSIWGGGLSYAASDDGTLAFVEGDSFEAMVLEAIDRQDGTRVRLGGPTYGHYARISPDGRRLTLTVRRVANDDIFTVDLSSGARQRLTFGSVEDESSVWSPDGREIAYTSSWRGDSRRIFIVSADGSEEARLVHSDPRHIHTLDWSPDGRWLLLEDMPKYNLSALSLESGEFRQVASLDAQETDAQFSPDGRWVVYASNESGRSEIYVVSFPEPTIKHQLSGDGGVAPRWSASNEIFYWRGSDLIAVPVSSEGAFSAGAPERIATLSEMSRAGISNPPPYDISPDGQTVYVLREMTDSAPQAIHVIRNWLAEVGTTRRRP